jgi:hypothetical protein
MRDVFMVQSLGKHLSNVRISRLADVFIITPSEPAVNPLPQINYVAVNPVTNPIYPAPIAVLYFAFFPGAITVFE